MIAIRSLPNLVGIWTITILSAAAADVGELHEHEGSLEVTLPYDTLIQGEVIHGEVRVENQGDEPLRVIRDGLNDGLQLVWMRWRDGEEILWPGIVPGAGLFKSSALETFADHNLDIHLTKKLDPGEEMVVERVHISSITGLFAKELENLQLRPAFYGGDGRVLYGDALELEVIPKSVNQFEKVFETSFSIGGQNRLPLNIHRVSIGEETYLYNNTGYRFCRIPPGVEFSISFEQDEQDIYRCLMTVEFDDPALEPLIFSWSDYALVSASRATVPWLFNKNGADPVRPKTLQKKQEPEPGAAPGTTESVQGSDENGGATSRLGLWFLLAAGAVGLGFVASRFSKRNSS